MPEEVFRKVSAKYSKPFSVQSIRNIAAHFNVSVLSTLIRFVECGTHPIFIAFCNGTNITWYSMSNDFPKWAFKFKVSSPPPQETVLGDYLKNRNEKCEEPIPHNPESWFYTKWDIDMEFYEQCIYSDEYGYNIGVLWFGK